jgi:hypothetical protein
MNLLPVLEGTVERRLLLTYRADPAVVADLLPKPFGPQLVNGFAVVGICMLRLGHIRPRSLPKMIGLGSENAAHRFAVQWTERGEPRTGVYIPRRDSASLVNVLTGDRLFPGRHERATFIVRECASNIAVTFQSKSGDLAVDVDASIADELHGSKLFAHLGEASEFFRLGSCGYSPSRFGISGMELRAHHWHVDPAVVNHARSSFFDDTTIFPNGSIELDSALVMRNIDVEWHSLAMGEPEPEREAIAQSA